MNNEEMIESARVPTNPERDSDLILSAGLRAVAAERDAALATIAQLAALGRDAPREWSTRLGESIVIALVAEREFDAILNPKATS